MANYRIGDCLYFHTGYSDYNIVPGNTAVIAGADRCGLCVRFDCHIGGHDCDIPDVIPNGYGWWLSPSDLDLRAYIIDAEREISAPDLEEVL